MNRGSSLPPAESVPGFVEERVRAVSDPPKVLQVPEPFQSIPAQELLRDNCRHCGWIRKEGGSIKTWTDRYVIIHKGCLYYYYKPESSTTAGKFSLSGYRLSPAPEKSYKYQWTFKLVNVQPEKRTYYFAAYSEQEMNEWMKKLSDDMVEYCGVAAQKTSPNNVKQADDQPEYTYPEVEPQFDPQDLPAVLRQLVLSPAASREGTQPTTGEMYCPPPDMIDTPFRPQQRKLPPVPEPRKEPIGRGMPKFSYTGGPGTGRGHQLLPPASGNFLSLGPSPLKRNPSPSREVTTPPVPLRQKPGPGLPLPVTPPMRNKPQPNLRKHLTAPKSPVENVAIQETGGRADEDEGEDYLAIVPDTDPRDFQAKTSTLQRRGDPDGKSFRRPQLDDVLPPSAVRLDLDKIQVATLLKRKLGVYIMRESQSTQSKRALSVWTGEKVSHYLIFYEQGLGYALEPENGPRFNSIEKLVRHYFEYNLPNAEVKLTMPYK